jgi:hypothetical protein
MSLTLRVCYIGPVIEPVGGTLTLQLSTVKILRVLANPSKQGR